ncbi:sporulation histidine kinase inhibitor Sda [Alkalibacillus salilacus]|uniref:Sporulation histidine kinase inhibitor Sda n=1 Tax=Alkalibacillus salilacus TaxID=284582 RepID=A0ABT9VI64_9BACI|nr:sporulation histidine kinase inhibitor Sda [Alkalibacillus salilacus]MDQ0160662.1 hypothetical protein [Alkalibacillus salilacus]
MFQLDDHALIRAYQGAKIAKAEQEFINLLEKELRYRKFNPVDITIDETQPQED